LQSRLPATQYGADASKDLARARRLGHVIVRTEFERDHAIDFPGERREHDHCGRVCTVRQRAEDGQSVLARHHHIQDDQVARRSSEPRAKRRAAVDRFGPKSVVDQEFGQQFAKTGIVVDDDDPRAFGLGIVAEGEVAPGGSGRNGAGQAVMVRNHVGVINDTFVRDVSACLVRR
jgi:hypothetical protein